MVTRFVSLGGKSIRLFRDSLRGVSALARSQASMQALLFAAGVTLLVMGLSSGAEAAQGTGLVTTYNDVRISGSVNAILLYIEGTFGALIMVAAGIGAIVSSAFGQYRAALSLLAVAVGSFILRSILSTFFNDSTIQA